MRADRFEATEGIVGFFSRSTTEWLDFWKAQCQAVLNYPYICHVTCEAEGALKELNRLAKERYV